MTTPDLASLFDQINQKHFDGFLDRPILKWNTRIRSAAGRFFPGATRFFVTRPPMIEVASYLLEEENSLALITDTVAHEMIHYWLWVRKRPYGHTRAFLQKMREMGVSRYNPVPRTRPYRYIYTCAGCNGEFKAKRKLGPLACAKCCKEHSKGRYDARFKLILRERIETISV